MKTTTIEIPVELRTRLQRLKTHPRQAYHEVIRNALEREGSGSPNVPPPGPQTDPLIARHRAAIARLARMHGVRNLRIFGSRARDAARPDSDLDLLFDLEHGRTLLDVVAFQQKLERLIGISVHLAELGGMRDEIRNRVVSEARPL